MSAPAASAIRDTVWWSSYLYSPGVFGMGSVLNASRKALDAIKSRFAANAGSLTDLWVLDTRGNVAIVDVRSTWEDGAPRTNRIMTFSHILLSLATLASSTLACPHNVPRVPNPNSLWRKFSQVCIIHSASNRSHGLTPALGIFPKASRIVLLMTHHAY